MTFVEQLQSENKNFLKNVSIKFQSKQRTIFLILFSYFFFLLTYSYAEQLYTAVGLFSASKDLNWI